MTSRNILVTGGAGYVGSHICKALAESGWLPVTYDDLSNGHDWAVKWGPLEIGDVRDRDRLEAVVRAYRPVGVMHLAGRIEVGESIRQPIDFYDINVNGTLSLLDVITRSGIKALIFSSTASTYGQLDQWPVNEDHACNPFTPYGRSKYLAEQMIADVGNACGLRWTVVRYFNAAGADPAGQIGEAHRNETHLIPLAIEAALGRREAFFIFGNDYPTPDGTCVRDFIHVSDLASAHVAALNRLLDGGRPALLNLGSGEGASVLEVVQALEQVTGMDVPTEVHDRRDGDQPTLVGDPSRARAMLSWEPRHSNLTSIVADALAWHSSLFFVETAFTAAQCDDRERQWTATEEASLRQSNRL